MGTNCAVYLANLYLFTYELDFVKRLKDANRFDLFDRFQFTIRYIDDLLSLKNPDFDSLKYISDDFEGVKGIYPVSLSLNRENVSSSEIHFLDCSVFKAHNEWMTKIYDKREHPPLNSIKDTRYPAFDSFLSSRSKYGVLTGQLHRFWVRCTRKRDFVTRSALCIRMLLQKGYSKSKLTFTLRRFVFKCHHMYAVKREAEFVKYIVNLAESNTCLI